MYEVFDPHNGQPYFTTRIALIARLVAWYTSGDYARVGQGWFN